VEDGDGRCCDCKLSETSVLFVLAWKYSSSEAVSFSSSCCGREPHCGWHRRQMKAGFLNTARFNAVVQLDGIA